MGLPTPRRDKTSGMRNRKKHEDAENEMILEIPELEADSEEDITRQVAEPPRALNNRMQTMDELDNDQQYNLPSNPDLDIDLSLLTTVLCSSEQVRHCRTPFTPPSSRFLSSLAGAALGRCIAGNGASCLSLLPHLSQVDEDADIWEPEILFTDVASELTLEAEAAEEDQAEPEVASP